MNLLLTRDRPNAPPLDPVSPFAKSAPHLRQQAAGRHGRDEMQLRDSQGEHFDSRCSFAAFHFLASTSAGGLLSDKSQDQWFAWGEDRRQGNWGYATSSSGPDCFGGSNETAKGHVYIVNNCDS